MGGGESIPRFAYSNQQDWLTLVSKIAVGIVVSNDPFVIIAKLILLKWQFFNAIKCIVKTGEP
jgi:hypothetical protein